MTKNQETWILRKWGNPRGGLAYIGLVTKGHVTLENLFNVLAGQSVYSCSERPHMKAE